MLYWFYTFFDIHILQYISVRAGIGFFTALLITLVAMPRFIKWAKEKNANQPIYSLAPSSHQAKSKVPTMGGVVFLFATLIATLIAAKLENAFVIGGLLTIILFSLIGIKDDLSKILYQQNDRGLSARSKLYMQFFAAFIISIVVLLLSNIDTNFYLPFYKFPLIDLGLSSLFLWVLVIVASSNSVNLTDGLDGLATVPTIFALFTLSVFAYVLGHAVLSEYLLYPKMIGVGEVTIIGASLIGALMGFFVVQLPSGRNLYGR
jgi:phospho-N-acetylmuramoyl-pentapeptide-transferase